VSQKQQQQKQTHDLRARTHSFTVGDLAYVRGYGSGQSNWIPSHIVQRTGPVSFKVKLESGIICRRHQDQLRKRFETVTEATSTNVKTDLTATGTFSPIPLNISEPTPNVPQNLMFQQNPHLSRTRLSLLRRIMKKSRKRLYIITPHEKDDLLNV